GTVPRGRANRVIVKPDPVQTLRDHWISECVQGQRDRAKRVYREVGGLVRQQRIEAGEAYDTVVQRVSYPEFAGDLVHGNPDGPVESTQREPGTGVLLGGQIGRAHV